MCRVLGVSRSGYYAYLRRGLSQRRGEYERLMTKIREIWTSRRSVYGPPRITAELGGSAVTVKVTQEGGEATVVAVSGKGKSREA